MLKDCPFCARIASGGLLAENELAVSFEDAYPVNPGHALIVPRRHESDFFALSLAEQQAVWALLAPVRDRMLAERSPSGFNIGINAGPAAGQTIRHAHLHVIPRHAGDVEDPRGGIRWVVPARARYWKP